MASNADLISIETQAERYADFVIDRLLRDMAQRPAVIEPIKVRFYNSNDGRYSINAFSRHYLARAQRLDLPQHVISRVATTFVN